LLRFINDNVRYLKNRPQALQHGDFHPGNLILTPKKTIGVIDFNRTDYGDPWEEYVRLTTFSKSVSVSFARGQIAGYFDGEVPEMFFRLTALYSALDAHFAINWAIPFGQQEIEYTLRRSQEIFEDYRGFETCIPVWYE
jgi:aminoglycoside phosphotransferase (APT) family kinase protein